MLLQNFKEVHGFFRQRDPILKKNRKVGFHFLWIGNMNTDGIPLFKWSSIALPKSLGGWGVRNIYLFSQALATKNI